MIPSEMQQSQNSDDSGFPAGIDSAVQEKILPAGFFPVHVSSLFLLPSIPLVLSVWSQ